MSTNTPSASSSTPDAPHSLPRLLDPKHQAALDEILIHYHVIPAPARVGPPLAKRRKVLLATPKRLYNSARYFVYAIHLFHNFSLALNEGAAARWSDTHASDDIQLTDEM
ncbi:hypothetical protein GGX14DRAFT_564094 [Mycena pura]|uniref:Uncharacterized protein n=1 Tax=Mycena pura TaxID=153505 RepID=A0AAD6VJ52_9AGAR|nr:hypothetical protein GGX14DRAFT_564094 [Mycena pura]